MINNNFVEIQNKILTILKDIEILNEEYKTLVNEVDKFSNSKRIDELESEIYDLEGVLLTNDSDSSYFLQVVDYKKWIIKNGKYIDNVDYLNKKINLSNILNERIAMIQVIDNNPFKDNNLLIYEQQESEYQRQMEEYQRQMEEYQQEVEYQRQMEEYQQEVEYQRQMQEYQQ